MLNPIFDENRDSERMAKSKLMEFLSSAISPSEHQPSHSQVVGTDSSGIPVLSNINELSVTSVAVSLAAGVNVNGNMTNQLSAFSNGIVSPEANSTVASNASISQLPGMC